MPTAARQTAHGRKQIAELNKQLAAERQCRMSAEAELQRLKASSPGSVSGDAATPRETAAVDA
jgi:hypothetical protein